MPSRREKIEKSRIIIPRLNIQKIKELKLNLLFKLGIKMILRMTKTVKLRVYGKIVKKYLKIISMDFKKEIQI